ncbi:DMT family transporter [Sporosarcina ureilytica]|uniref:Multidrug transporter n=1 Tax=Sporosarcina ureilytica TaxID=298596 RepID=A0A1D8JJM6_9BACL|nr:EamA family transporter [Sporosarcina ureilytica]AOV08916.1 multidrug transporter [Sporosarcina ureilytica]
MSRLKGITMIISGAVLWGATGPMMEWLLRNSDMSVTFMLTIRLLLAGIILLTILKLQGKRITAPWRQRVWSRQLIIFGIIGMLGVQLSFASSIDTSNAVIATLFQFLAPIYIILFVSWTHRKLPPAVQGLGMVITLVGLFFLLTNGSLSGFTLSKIALFWGLAVGFSFAFYTLYPARLMQEWGVLISVGWAMVIGGVTLLITQMNTVIKQFRLLGDWGLMMMLLLIIVVGTAAFILFLGSMKYITAVEASILSSFEPLTAMVISVIWFGQILGLWQFIGAITMLIGVTWISVAGSKIETASDDLLKE